MVLTLRAGQTGRLTVTRSNNTPASAAPIGAVEVKHIGPVSMETDSETGDLLVHPMPPGMHPFEVRLGGRTIADGHFEVLPSPLDGVLGEQSWEVQAAEAPRLATFNISWPRGEKGDPGKDAGVTAEEVETQIAAALHGNFTDIFTPKGTENATYVYADIPAKYIPAGKLHSITLQGSTDAGAYEGEAYLIIWQEQASGTDDFRPVAISVNAVKMEPNKACEWQFDAPVMLNERIRFYLTDTQTLTSWFGWRSEIPIRSRANSTPRWQEGHVFTPYTVHALPELTIRMETPSELYAPRAHTSEWWAHLSYEEHKGLDALLAQKDAILALLPATQDIPEDEPVAVGGVEDGSSGSSGEDEEGTNPS